MPNTHETLVSLFEDCADAIREKDGTSSPIVADLFPERIRAIPQGGGDITVEPLPVSANGTYTAPTGHAYSPVTVNVPTGTPRTSSDVTVSGATVSVPAGLYGSAVSKSVASGSAGTPTAAKGSVSNHSITVTPKVTNSTGYITGGTKTGSGVTVSASELVSGSETKTANGTYDVTNLASLTVNVQGGGGVPSPITAGDFPVLVNTNSYTCTMTDSAEQTIHATGLKIKVPKAGTYRFKWSASKQTDGTSRKDGSTRLYKNGTAVGSLHTFGLGNTDTPAFTEDIACSANDEIEIWIAAGTWTFGLLGTYSGGGAYGFCACINWNPWN